MAEQYKVLLGGSVMGKVDDKADALSATLQLKGMEGAFNAMSPTPPVTVIDWSIDPKFRSVSRNVALILQLQARTWFTCEKRAEKAGNDKNNAKVIEQESAVFLKNPTV
jgi:hypothetical protein